MRTTIARSRVAVLACSLCFASQIPVRAVGADAGADFDAALKAAQGFEYGKDAAPLELVERQILAASGDAARKGKLEEQVLGALRAATTRDAKEFLCRQLRTIASASSVPALEAMLSDAELAPLARFALERIEDKSAGEALRRAMKNAGGKTLAGIFASVGRRRDPGAVADITQHLSAADFVAAQAAAAALGAIGGVEAVMALAQARGNAAPLLAIEIDNALLLAAERFLAAGDAASAATIYHGFLLPEKPRHVRLGALHGLVAAGDSSALEATIAALRDADVEVRLGAIEACRTLHLSAERDLATTSALASVLPSLAPDTQACLVQAIGSRPGGAALSAVRGAMESTHEDVRIAAFDVLGRIGDAADAERLLRSAANPAAVGEMAASAARSSLLALRGEKLAAAVARITPLTGDAAADVRGEAITFLGAVAKPAELSVLAGLLVAPKDPSDRAALEKAIAGALARLPAKERSAETLLAPLRQAAGEARPALVRLLVNVGNSAALAEVRARLADADAPTRAAAVRALADWPDAAPVADLLELVSKLGDAASKETALRGYVRLVSLSPESIEPYRRALAVVAQPDERAIVLAGLSAVPMSEALDVLEAAFVDESVPVREAAARAAVAVADKIRGLDSSRARAAVEKAWVATPDAEVKRKGQAVIDQIEKFQGHLLAWAVSGPYQEDGKDARALFDAALLPETPAAKDAPWRRLRRGVGAWDLDLAEALGSADNVAAFVRATITSPLEREVRLELGSDDAIKVWLNGTLVHANFLSRALQGGEDRVAVKLRQGANELLLKIVNISGPWGFACRVRGADGALVNDLKVAPALRAAGAADFQPLFDGKSLDGWEQKGGKALYRVDGNVIVGQTVPNTPNSFLCTRERYGDFIFEYEFHCDAALNSGVQIRSNVYDAEKEYEVDGKKLSVPAGRVHGYQVEIDPNQPERAWVGCIYDEGRRGWLYPGSRGGDGKKVTEQGQRLYKPGDWNHVRVEAIGPSLKTWLNGELRAELKDDLTLEGFIALQVHGVGGRKEPLEVRWRNLRLQAVTAGVK